jgi:hypothetical protein
MIPLTTNCHMSRPRPVPCHVIRILTLFPRSFAIAWEKSMKVHEVMADNRMRFASTLNEMSEDLNNLAKEVDKTRKQASTSRVLFRNRSLMFDSTPDQRTAHAFRAPAHGCGHYVRKVQTASRHHQRGTGTHPRRQGGRVDEGCTNVTARREPQAHGAHKGRGEGWAAVERQESRVGPTTRGRRAHPNVECQYGL